jgi:hypothetical protein
MNLNVSLQKVANKRYHKRSLNSGMRFQKKKINLISKGVLMKKLRNELFPLKIMLKKITEQIHLLPNPWKKRKRSLMWKT